MVLTIASAQAARFQLHADTMGTCVPAGLLQISSPVTATGHWHSIRV